MKQKSHQHHYVPQFYQSFFLPDGQGRFWVYDKKASAPRPQAPSTTALENDFHTFPRKDGGTDTRLEDEVFGPSEGQAAAIIKAWLNEWRLPYPSEIETMNLFLALMYLRVPRTAALFSDIDIAHSVESMKLIASNPEQFETAWHDFGKEEGGLSRDEFRQWLSNPEKFLSFKPDMKYGLAESLGELKTIGQLLLTFNWSILVAPKGSFFVTSDCPVVVFSRRPDGRVMLGCGFGQPTCEVYFPLSPVKCLLLTRGHKPQVLRSNQRGVSEVNRRMIWTARRFVISPYQTNELQEMVRFYADTQPTVNRERIAQDLRDPGAAAQRYGRLRSFFKKLTGGTL